MWIWNLRRWKKQWNWRSSSKSDGTHHWLQFCFYNLHSCHRHSGCFNETEESGQRKPEKVKGWESNLWTQRNCLCRWGIVWEHWLFVFFICFRWSTETMRTMACMSLEQRGQLTTTRCMAMTNESTLSNKRSYYDSSSISNKKISLFTNLFWHFTTNTNCSFFFFCLACLILKCEELISVSNYDWGNLNATAWAEKNNKFRKCRCTKCLWPDRRFDGWQSKRSK